MCSIPGTVWDKPHLMADSDEQRYGPSSLIRCNFGLGLVLNRRPIYSDILNPALPTEAAHMFGVKHVSSCVAHLG